VTEQGVAARLLRKEDERLMRGRGQFVADLRFAGMKGVAFVRSLLAHPRLRSVSVPDDYKEAVFTADHLADEKPIRPVSGLRGFKPSDHPPLQLKAGTLVFAEVATTIKTWF
jgi:aerobic carbon-monoxide dehydrogenase large subunit